MFSLSLSFFHSFSLSLSLSLLCLLFMGLTRKGEKEVGRIQNGVLEKQRERERERRERTRSIPYIHSCALDLAC